MALAWEGGRLRFRRDVMESYRPLVSYCWPPATEAATKRRTTVAAGSFQRPLEMLLRRGENLRAHPFHPRRYWCVSPRSLTARSKKPIPK